MKKLIIFLTFSILGLLGCKQFPKEHPEESSIKTIEQALLEYEELKKEERHQIEENLHNAMPHLMKKAQERGDFTDFSHFYDFNKNIEDLNILQSSFLDEEIEAVVAADSINTLRKLIYERMIIEFPAMRKQFCKVLLYYKPNNDFSPTLNDVQCDGIAYDTLELISTDFIKRKNIVFFLYQLRNMRFKQITFRMKKNYRDFKLYKNKITDTTMIKRDY